MNTTKTNKYLSTCLLVLIIVGYPLVTTAFLPNFEIYEGKGGSVVVSRVVTVPYRAFVLGLSLLVMVLNWKRQIHFNWALNLYFIFWFFLSIRIVYDLEIRTDIIVDPSVVQNQYLYTYLVCLIPTFAVLKGTRAIDFDMAFKWIIAGYCLFVPLLAYNTPNLFTTIDTGARQTGNIAMNPILLGHCGTTLALLGLCLPKLIKDRWMQIVACVLILIGFFIILRSGSRGPLIAFIGTTLFIFIAGSKSFVKMFVTLVVAVVSLVALSDFLFESISNLSPVMASRLKLSGNITQYGELSTGRDVLFKEAIDKFVDHPIAGDTFALFNPDGTIWYSHNIILDAFMSLGLFGGIIFVIIVISALWRSYLMIHVRQYNMWVGVLCVGYIINHQFSFPFYQADILNVLLAMQLQSFSYLSHIRNK